MKKLNLAIVLGVVAALVGGALVFAYGRNVDAKIAGGRAATPVLVATQSLIAGTPGVSLKNSTALRKMPRAFVAEGALTSLDSVATMTLVAPVPAGAQLTRLAFALPSDAGSLKPSKGNVALAVGVDLVPGVARYITAPGMVDLFVTFPSGGPAVGGVPGAPVSLTSASRTKLFATGVKVMSVSVAPPPQQKADEPKDAPPVAASDQVIAVLDVSPADAERIVNSATLGKLYLGLSDGDPHTTPSGVTPDDVVKSNR